MRFLVLLVFGFRSLVFKFYTLGIGEHENMATCQCLIAL